MQLAEFRKIDISDQKYFNRQLALRPSMSCEQSWLNLYCWQDSCDTQWFEYNNQLFIWYAAETLLLMPTGDFIPPAILTEILNAVTGKNNDGTIYDVPQEYLDLYPEIEDKFIISEDDAEFDYIYKTDKLINFSGKKLRKKRNLLKQFAANYPDSLIEPLTSQHSSDCIELNAKISIDNAHLTDETKALKRCFSVFNELDILGTVIYVADQLIGFSVVSQLNETTACEHFEKIDHQYKGAAQVLVNETAKQLPNKILYLNREQDMGIAGLRQAKRSYDPELILKRYKLALK